MQSTPSTMTITRMMLRIVEIIGDSPETTSSKFDPREDRTKQSDSTYIVPDNQRFDAWTDDKKKEGLIDSIMRNYPMPSFVMSRHRCGEKEVYHVQDGQQRLRTMQKFILGKFTWNNRKFSELSRQEERIFLGYTIYVDVIVNANRKELAQIFERINSGKPLKDNDKYHNMLDSNVLRFIMKTLIVHPELVESFARYCGPIGAGKTRSLLKDIVGAVMPIIQNSVDYIRTSYEINGYYLEDEFSESDAQRVILIFKEYFHLISTALSEAPIVGNVKKNYLKLGNMLGLFIFYKLSGEDVPHVSECCWKRYAVHCQDSLWASRMFRKLHANRGAYLSGTLKFRIELLSKFNGEMDEFPKVGNSSADDSDDDSLC